MKNLFKLPIAILYLIVLVSCSTDLPDLPPLIEVVKPQVPEEINDDDPEENNDGNTTGINFGFFDSGTSSANYIDMPIESSSTNLFVGRWKIIKIGVDEDDNGDLEYSYNYEDYANKDCGLSF